MGRCLSVFFFSPFPYFFPLFFLFLPIISRSPGPNATSSFFYNSPSSSSAMERDTQRNSSQLACAYSLFPFFFFLLSFILPFSTNRLRMPVFTPKARSDTDNAEAKSHRKSRSPSTFYEPPPADNCPLRADVQQAVRLRGPEPLLFGNLYDCNGGSACPWLVEHSLFQFFFFSFSRDHRQPTTGRPLLINSGDSHQLRFGCSTMTDAAACARP